MKLLKDDELTSLLVGTKFPIITGLPQNADWYCKTSPIQPSSVDLHIGDIFEPGKKREEKGGESKPLSSLVLEPGHTAIVTTLEELVLPNDIAGLAFPPSRVSFQGLLMTNPGHIDPGYTGKMHLTVINMAKERYILRSNEMIITLLLVQLSGDPKSSWRQREGGKGSKSLTQDDIDRLSADFIDVENRAKTIAQEIADKAIAKSEISQKSFDNKIKWYGAFAGLLAVVLSGIFSYFQASWKAPMAEAKAETNLVKAEFDAKVDLLKKELEFLKVSGNSVTRLDQMEVRLKNIESRSVGGKQKLQSSGITLDKITNDKNDPKVKK